MPTSRRPVVDVRLVESSVTLDPGDIEIGAVEIKDATGTDRLKVAATGSIAEGNIAAAVHDPVLGATTGAALDADGTGTIQQYLRGLLKAFLARIPVIGSQLGSASMSVVPASDSFKVAATNTIAEGDKAAAVHDPVLGASTGAALDADGTGTLQQYLRGLLKAFLARIPAIGPQTGAASLSVVAASDGLNVNDRTVVYAGTTSSAASGAVEGRLDCSALGGATYPMLVRVHARGADIYIAQGKSTVTLNATAADNELIEDGARAEYVITSANSGYFAHKAASGSGVLAVTRVDLPIP